MGTWICFDTTLSDQPVGPYPHQKAKNVSHGDIKAVRIIQGYQCVEPDSTRFRVGLEHIFLVERDQAAIQVQHFSRGVSSGINM